MIAKLSLTLAAIAALSGPVWSAQPISEQYMVNAQYRGGVKKGFSDIGRGHAVYQQLSPMSFKVEVEGRAHHPNKSNDYVFDMSQTFQVAGNEIRLTGTEKMNLNENAKQNEAQLTEMMPFAYLARTLPVPGGGGDQTRMLNYRGQSYALRYRQAEGALEVTVYRGEEMLGKFFLGSDPGPQMAQLQKFRVAIPEDHLMVSFVVTSGMALEQSQQ